jgi:cytochrome d ubiquinol oxidase subunit I
MDVELLSRIQFGLTAGFHFIYPPLTIGLGVLIAIIEFMYLKTNDEIYRKMADFWAKLFAINFVVGVATGIVMEFEFGTNWSNYARFVGDIFGSPLAAEGIFAFFLESTFLGLYLVGKNRLSRFMRFFSFLMVAFGSTLSALWILIANSWQQTPAGYKVEGGRAVLTNFWEAVFNPTMPSMYLHTVDASFITGAMFMAGVSAYFLIKGKNLELAKRSLKLAVVFGVIVSILQLFPFGDESARVVAQTQPEKLASFEGLFKTQSKAPLLVFGIPDPSQNKMLVEIGIPGALSFLADHNFNAVVKGIDSFPKNDLPPMTLTFYSFHLMVALGTLFILTFLVGVYLLYKKKIYTTKPFLAALWAFIPLPYIANELGWITTEVGRQPWAVYGLLRTKDAFSPLPVGDVWLSLIGFTLVYAVLFGVFLYLIIHTVKSFKMD